MRHWIIGAAFAAAFAVDAAATVIISADVADLSRDAQAIARGRVVAAEAQWADGARRVETLVTLDVAAWLKGGAGSSVQFKVPGGRLGRYRSVMVGAPGFAIGEQVVVFLGARGPAIPHVLGLHQGVFRLVPTQQGWVVSRGSEPLAQFESRIRLLAGSAR